MGPNGQPFDKIRAYFGEKISLFFEFRAHLTSWLLWPALLGFALECVVVSTYDFSHPVIPFFALLIAVWSVLMTEFWKRREISVAMEAGMVGFEVSIQDRPEYKVSSFSGVVTDCEESGVLDIPPLLRSLFVLMSASL